MRLISQIAVIAVAGIACMPTTEKFSPTPASGPGCADVPENVSVSLASQQDFTVTWASEIAESFVVEFSPPHAGWSELGTSTTTHFDTDALDQDTVFQFRVSSVRDNCTSAPSAPVSIEATSKPPQALIATATGAAQATLTWLDPNSRESAYRVERKDAGDYATLASLPTNATVFVDNTLASSTTYTYRVSALNAGGVASSTESNPISTPPTLVSVSPEDGTTNVSLSAKVDIAFSETLAALSPNAVVVTDAEGTAVSGGLTLAGSVVHFAPAQPLIGGERYTVKISGSVASVSGTPLGQDASFSFTTLFTRFAFMSQAGAPGTVSIFSVDAKSGKLHPEGYAAAGNQPAAVVVEPSQRFVYVANQTSGSVSGYGIDAVTGALTPLPGSPFTVLGQPTSLAATPDRLYVVLNNQGKVETMSLDGSGALTELDPGSFTDTDGNSNPGHIVMAPDGTHAYVANAAYGTVSVLTIDANGVPTPVAPATPAGGTTDGLAITHDGHFLYAASNGDGTIVSFSVAADGSVSVLGAPLSIGIDPKELSIDASDRLLLAADPSTQKSVELAREPTTGVLSILAGGTQTESNDISAVSFEPMNRYAFVVNRSAGQLSTYGLDATASGAPIIAKTDIEQFATGVAWYTAAAPLSVVPQRIYLSDYSNNALDAYDEQANGDVTAIGEPLSVATGPLGMKANRAGTALYVGLFAGLGALGGIQPYSADDAGALTALTGIAQTETYQVAVDPSQRFVFAVSASEIASYNIQSDGNLMPQGSIALPNIGNDAGRSLAVDPFGRWIFVGVKDSALIGVYTVNPTNGALTVSAAPDTATVGFSTRALAVHPNGHYLYAASSGSKGIYGFAKANGVSAPEALSGSPWSAMATVFDVTIDRSGRFLYAVDNANASVLAYSIFPLNGALSAIPGSPFATLASPVSVGVDVSGTSLYVGASGGFVRYAIDPDSGGLSLASALPTFAATARAFAFTSLFQ